VNGAGRHLCHVAIRSAYVASRRLCAPGLGEENRPVTASVDFPLSIYKSILNYKIVNRRKTLQKKSMSDIRSQVQKVDVSDQIKAC